MGLTVAQRSQFEAARKVGNSKQGVPLTDGACRALCYLAARDLGCLPVLPLKSPHPDLPDLYAAKDPASLELPGPDPVTVYEALVERGPKDADSYFTSLAAIHRGRLKYSRILATQPVPTVEQVGPRGLLEYGGLDTKTLMALLIWRKWMFDIDNRSGQETGYLFEPILARSIGGTPAPAKKSPIRRASGAKQGKGRQVDCLRGKDAYEFKLRVTIAASGQGRWGEELAFTEDCKSSGHVPILVVLDSTKNPKLEELTRAFEKAGGRAYAGEKAWAHLEAEAGPTMAAFLEKYVRAPLRDLLQAVPTELPPMTLNMMADRVVFGVAGSEYVVRRGTEDPALATPEDEIPEDAVED